MARTETLCLCAAALLVVACDSERSRQQSTSATVQTEPRGTSVGARAAPVITGSGDAGVSPQRAPPPTGSAAAPGTCAALRERLAIPATDGEVCDKGACAAAGGECSWGGFACPRVCIRRARDAGARCTDEAECESTCVAPEGARPGEAVAGKCYHLALNKACLNVVRRGVAFGVVCID